MPECHPARRRILLGVAVPMAVLAAIVAVPGAAQAAFTRSAAASMTMGSLTLAAPTPLSASLSCPTGSNSTGTATVSWPPVSRATSYLVTLNPPTGAAVTKTVSTTSSTISAPGSKKDGGTWTVSVSAQVASWTGLPRSASTTC